MKSRANLGVLLACLTVTLPMFSADTVAQQSLAGQDIGQLLAQAQQRFDLPNEDAVFLFDGEKAYWLPDGRLVRFVHRIIWINTAVAISRYGDHRIPYDDAHCTISVATVRTWRDSTWWETGPTGKVETLPSALREAYDYTDLREMMLLHNGIELPCILELAYSIEDRAPFRTGADGLWTFQREEPVVQSWFGMGVPKGTKPNVNVSSGVPAPEGNPDEKWGVDLSWWKMGPLDAIPRPHTSDVAADVPHLVWSTWKDWNELGNQLAGVFNAAITEETHIKHDVDSVTSDARTDGEKALKVTELVNARTRLISYPERHWWTSPRPAARTLSTAYGHRLDRAVLAAAMFRAAGLSATPVFIGLDYGEIDAPAPTLSRMSGVGLHVAGEDLDAFYDPSRGTVSNGMSWQWGRVVWHPGKDGQPALHEGDGSIQSVFDLRIDLAYDDEKGRFTGTGLLLAENALCPYERMVGTGDEAKRYLASAIAGVLSGANVAAYNPVRFDRKAVTVGFSVELNLPATDDSGRFRLVIGDPAGGLFDYIPEDVKLYHRERQSPVRLSGLMTQRIEVRLKPGPLDVRYRPDRQASDNAVGEFQLAVRDDSGMVVISRELNLKKRTYASGEWAALRGLLLADKHERARTVILRTKK